MSNSIPLREAKPEDAPVLSKLAMHSKAYWGYSDEFMEACREELTTTPEKIRDSAFHFVVAEISQKIVGFYGVERLSLQQFELEALFVDPLHIGSGIGRALMTHAKHYIAAYCGNTLLIQGDPNAEGFYRAVGAQYIGDRESASIPGRLLPVFSISIAKSA
ncbi:MAG: GNAT family N-acetyltransferase [Cyanobacteria bacterium J06636_16]